MIDVYWLFVLILDIIYFFYVSVLFYENEVNHLAVRQRKETPERWIRCGSTKKREYVTAVDEINSRGE